MTDFQQKLTLSVIDKLVFGLLIVLAGFVLNRTLENYKSDQATKAEIARLRVTRVAKVWTQLNEQQEAIDDIDPAMAFVARWSLRPASERPARQMKQRFHTINTATFAFRRRERSIAASMRTNRFWIGEVVYPRYLEYAQRQRSLLHAYENLFFVYQNRRAQTDAIREVRARRQDLRDARSDVFGVIADLQ